MIIVLVGKIGSGKSTVADFLKSRGFIELSFAEPIKQFAIALGFENKSVYGTQAEKNTVDEFWGISGRQMMQRFGTDIMRNYGHMIEPSIANIWVKALEQKITTLKKDCDIVISDCRFEDEAVMARSHNALIVRLERDNTQFNIDHESEKNTDKIRADYVYKNNKTKEDLRSFIQTIIENSTCLTAG